MALEKDIMKKWKNETHKIFKHKMKHTYRDLDFNF